MDLEFLITDAAYASDLSEPATYINRSKASKVIQVVPDQIPFINLNTADAGIRGKRTSVRVRKSDIDQPCKGDRVMLYDREHCVDDFDRLNEAEWVLYVTT